MRLRKIFLPAMVATLGLAMVGCDNEMYNTETENNPTQSSATPTELQPTGSTPATTVPTTVTVYESKANTANYQVPAGGLSKDDEMTITFYHTMGDSLQKVLQEAIDDFQKDYPKIVIDSQAIGGYDDVLKQISTEIGVDEQPNMAYCYSDHVATYNRSKVVVQLDNLISDPTYGLTEQELADFVPGYYNEGKCFGDDYMYTLPFSKSSEVLYYNKTAFDAHGWDITKAQTWDGMMELCAQILVDDPDCIPLGIDSEANLFIELCEQTGTPYTSATGNHYLFRNEKAKDMVTKFKGWFDAGYFTTQTILTTYTSSLFTSNGQADKDGKVTKRSYMSIGSTGGASHQYADFFECAVTTIPTWKDGTFKVISQGPSICLFKKDNPKEVLASWIFLTDYLLTPEFQIKFAMASGYNPVFESCYDVEILDPEDPLETRTIKYSDWLDKAQGTSGDGTIALAAKVCRSMVDNYFTSPAFNGSSNARQQVGALLVAVLSGSRTVDGAFDRAILECED